MILQENVSLKATQIDSNVNCIFSHKIFMKHFTFFLKSPIYANDSLPRNSSITQLSKTTEQSHVTQFLKLKKEKINIRKTNEKI